ncbi:uncharacterized protein LOC119595720 [Penaeus monodon]|uniref:uncharacterized protein LOC119595720 n=1 Tax=Penaeus monodon TaxID=6687 RepID=UPI0018A6D667|nr:uncharacterized protein LOC119595720 [Penaeus monodon]XP_037800758.1 uncharacterized protein LOC119595720 [Penaeus monodon]
MRITDRPIIVGAIFGILVLLFYFSKEMTLMEKSISLLTSKDSKQGENERAATSELRVPEEFPFLSAQDPVLLEYVKQRLIQPPAVGDYNLSKPDGKHFSQYSQSQVASKLLEGLDKGFFLEAGALDGEDKSNSLYFERERSWTGLLVEPDPSLYKTLVSKKRKAFSINAAFSLSNASDMVTFLPRRGLGRLAPGSTKGIPVKTVPIATMLQALGVTQIDYFSLDIEGAELKVLATFPWDKVKIRLICIEVNHVGLRPVDSFMKKQGYTYVGKWHIDAWYGWKDLLQETINVDEYPKELTP